MNILIIIGSLIVLCVIAIFSYNLGIHNEHKSALEKIGSAENKARTLLDEAIKKAETAKVNALLEAKEEILKNKTELENEIRERRKEVSEIENRALKRDELSEKKAEALDYKEAYLTDKENELNADMAKCKELLDKRVAELERISSCTREQAKSELLESVKDDIKHDTAVFIKEQEQIAKDEVDKNCKEIILQAIQRSAMENVSYATVSVVDLPNDEMKGRIIGREGRNIRSIEQLTGCEVIIDDTPEAVVLSCFDPIKREIARLSVEKLVSDGRIHPARIEELVEKSKQEVDKTIKEKGEEAVYKLGIRGVNPELIKIIGRLHFRTSYGQNALVHSIEVATFTGIMAAELGYNVQLAKRAGLLHDIGKAIDHENEEERETHVKLGSEICKRYKESFEVINAVESHHGDVPAKCPIAFLVGAADAISAARPGARRETMETYNQRIKQLEEIPSEFEGVEKAFAIQAGREVRVMVVPNKVSDDDMVVMARDIAKRIEDEVKYPGNIKVNVIRETRVQDIAK